MGHETCITACADCAACAGEVVYSALFKSISTCLAAKMTTAVNYICGVRSDIEIGQASAAQAQDQSVEALVRGDLIREEFRDTELPIGPAIEAATENAKDFIKKCPVFFFGLARQGKSTLVNDLLHELGDASRPAKEDFLKPCTRGVQVYKRLCSAWTTAGVQEEVLLFDTEGWEFHRQEAASRLLASCMQLAVEEMIQPAVLKHRLVLVVVLDMEHRWAIFDYKFLSLVREVCRQAADAAGAVKPVLLPVVSKDDHFRSEHDCQRVCSHFGEELKKSVGELVDVQDALSVSHWKTDESGMRPCVQELNKTLARICTQQLKSEPLLAKVKEIIEDDLLRHLQEWEKQGLDSSHALVRRFLWVVAGHRRLRIRNLFEKRPTLLWEGTTGVIARVKRGPGHAMLESTHAWHSDPRRLKSSCRSLDLTAVDSTDSGSSGITGASSRQSLTDSD